MLPFLEGAISQPSLDLGGNKEEHTTRIFCNPLQYQEWPAPKCSVIIGNKQEILYVKHPGINTDIEETFALKSPDIEGTPKRI